MRDVYVAKSTGELAQFRTLALIPARAGSKGLPDKNILKVGGTSLLELAIRSAQGARYIDDVLLSTDSHGYAAMGRDLGAWVPFIRPAHLASDHANIMDTVKYVVSELESKYQKSYDAVLIVEPSSPCRTSHDLDNIVSALCLNDQASAVAAVSPLAAHYHPRKVLQINDSLLEPYAPSDSNVTNRQELDTLYIRNGVGYALRVSGLKNRSNAISGATIPFLIDRPVVNIDDENDLAYFKFLLETAS